MKSRKTLSLLALLGTVVGLTSCDIINGSSTPTSSTSSDSALPSESVSVDDSSSPVVEESSDPEPDTTSSEPAPDTTSSEPGPDSSSSEPVEDSSSVWIDYGSTELTDEMLEAVSGNNLTLTGRYIIGMADGATPYGVQIKMDDGQFYTAQSTIATDWETGEDFPLTTEDYYFRGENGNASYYYVPNRLNQTEYDANVSFDDSPYFTNKLGSLVASDFVIDYNYNGPGYKFVLDNSEKATVAEEVYLATTYIASAQSITMFGETVDELAIYTDGEKITSYGISASSILDYGLGPEYVYHLLASVYVEISDVGTTVIDDTAFKEEPYAVPEGQEAQYEAFAAALKKTEEHSYTFDAFASEVESGDIIQTSSGVVTPTGWAGTESDSSGTPYYYGVTALDDGSYEYYTGSAVDALSGSRKTYSPHSSLPTYEIAPEIFDLDTEKSNDSTYVFTLKEDYLEHFAASGVVEYVTYDSFSNYASDLSITVNSDGTLKSFAFHYASGSVDYVFEQTYSNWGTTTEIPATLFTSENYVPVDVPTSYADAVDISGNQVSDTLALMDGGDAAIFPLTEALEPYYMGIVCGTLSSSTAAIQFQFLKEATSASGLELFDLVTSEMNTLLGAEMILDDYYVEASLTVGKLTYVVAMTSNYSIVVQIQGTIASTSGDSSSGV